MPPPAIEPSGTTVERLCGQPEQKKGWRASVSGVGRSRSASSRATRAVMDPRLSFFSRREASRSEEHTSELQSLAYLVCRLLLEKKKNKTQKEAKGDNHTDRVMN